MCLLGKSLPAREELVLGSLFEAAWCVGITARSAELELSGVRQVDRSRKEAQGPLKSNRGRSGFYAE